MLSAPRERVSFNYVKDHNTNTKMILQFNKKLVTEINFWSSEEERKHDKSSPFTV